MTRRGEVERHRIGKPPPAPGSVTKAAKVAHVKAARQVGGRRHMCHWPGCSKAVPPAKWGCYPHWMKLPKRIRDRIWNAYKIGQEETFMVSKEYIAAAHEAQEWIKEHGE